MFDFLAAGNIQLNLIKLLGIGNLSGKFIAAWGLSAYGWPGAMIFIAAALALVALLNGFFLVQSPQVLHLPKIDTQPDSEQHAANAATAENNGEAISVMNNDNIREIAAYNNPKSANSNELDTDSFTATTDTGSGLADRDGTSNIEESSDSAPVAASDASSVCSDAVSLSREREVHQIQRPVARRISRGSYNLQTSPNRQAPLLGLMPRGTTLSGDHNAANINGNSGDSREVLHEDATPQMLQDEDVAPPICHIIKIPHLIPYIVTVCFSKLVFYTLTTWNMVMIAKYMTSGDDSAAAKVKYCLKFCQLYKFGILIISTSKNVWIVVCLGFARSDRILEHKRYDRNVIIKTRCPPFSTLALPLAPWLADFSRTRSVVEQRVFCSWQPVSPCVCL